MNEITPEQKTTWTKEALAIIGFEEMPAPGILAKQHQQNLKILVDLNDKQPCAIFIVGGKRVTIDDEHGTLLIINQIIVDAKGGKMPTISEPTEVVTVPRPSVVETMHPAEPTNDVPKTAEPVDNVSSGESVPAVPEPAQACASSELVQSTAPPAPFEPQGMMIKNLIPMLKEVGKIKIGRKGEMRKSQGGKDYRPPEKFDHFEVVTLYKDDNGYFIPDATIMGLIGDDAKELEISLLYNDPSLNFFTRYNQYKGGKCMCSGDGETAIQADGTKIKCNPDTCSIFKVKKCKPNGILSVILKDAPRLGGVYKFRTTSFNSIRSIMSSMFVIQSLTGGILANIPLKMTIAPMSVNPVGSTTAQTIFVVTLEYPGTVDDLRKQTLQLMTEQAGMHSKMIELEAQARAAISAPETKEEIQDVELEFYPETVKEESA